MEIVLNIVLGFIWWILGALTARIPHRIKVDVYEVARLFTSGMKGARYTNCFYPRRRMMDDVGGKRQLARKTLMANVFSRILLVGN